MHAHTGQFLGCAYVLDNVEKIFTNIMQQHDVCAIPVPAIVNKLNEITMPIEGKTLYPRLYSKF